MNDQNVPHRDAMQPSVHSLLIRPDTADAALEISLVAPQWLDPLTKRALKQDPVRTAWEDVQEAFVHLHAQRTIELLRAIVASMPAREKMVLEWEYDEHATLWVGFSNGWWGTTGQFSLPDTPFQRYDRPEAPTIAPTWYPRAKEGTARWEHWYQLLASWSVDPGVDHKVGERLDEGLKQTGGVVSRSTLPVLEKALLSGKWADGLEASRLAETLPSATPSSDKKFPRM